jgi:hypothetical protein
MRKNPLILNECEDEESPIEGLSSGSFPYGISQVPFRCKTPQEEKSMEFLAGFLGILQDSQTLALKPKLGWAVRDAEWIELALARIKKDHQTFPPADFDRIKQGVLLGFLNFSGEMFQFYKETDGAILFPEKTEMTCQILSFEKRERVKFSSPTGWTKICELSDGSCYAYTAEGDLGHWKFPFIHTNLEKIEKPEKCPVVALSFAELLEKILNIKDKIFHEEEGFKPHGWREIPQKF